VKALLAVKETKKLNIDAVDEQVAFVSLHFVSFRSFAAAYFRELQLSFGLLKPISQKSSRSYWMRAQISIA
jgi:hypothetical protein